MENNLFSAAWERSNALYSRAAAVLGVGYPEMIVLYALETTEGLTQTKIAEFFGLQKPTVNTVVTALYRKGYLTLEQCTEDRREKRVILTETGREYAHRIVEPLRRAEDRVYRMIGTEALQAMCETLELFNLLFERELNEGLKNG